MNIGTNTGANIAHFAEALPINKLTKATKMTKATINGTPVKPISLRNSAPLMAMIGPKLLA